jgi:hypothetical protein
MVVGLDGEETDERGTNACSHVFFCPDILTESCQYIQCIDPLWLQYLMLYILMTSKVR